MRDYVTLSTTLEAKVAEEADFLDEGHKEYKIVFNLIDRQGGKKKYTVIVNRRHLTSAGYGDYGDSKKAALQFALFVLKKRFTLSTPPENTAICRGKMCEYVTIAE